MNIAVIYFSATGNTGKIAKTISEYLKSHEDVNIEEIDITSYSSRDKEIKLDKYEGVFFGFPIYALRAPKLLRDWLKTLEGKNKMERIVLQMLWMLNQVKPIQKSVLVV